MNTTQIIDFAATIGLDWADRQHDLWICPAGSSKAEHLRLDQTPEVLHEWVAKVRQRFNNQRVAIGIETSRGPVISALICANGMPRSFDAWSAARNWLSLLNPFAAFFSVVPAGRSACTFAESCVLLEICFAILFPCADSL